MTALTETIEALERAANYIRSVSISIDYVEPMRTDAARLDALAKALKRAIIRTIDSGNGIDEDVCLLEIPWTKPR